MQVLGNACSDAFDEAAAETRAQLRGSGVLRQLLRLLEISEIAERTTLLYSAAALQNLCKDHQHALAALELGAPHP